MNTRSFAGQNQSLVVAQQQLENGQIEYATQILEELLTKNPENVDALHLMSMAHYMKGNLIEAINCCKTACELMPDNITLLNNLGNFLKANQDYIPAKVAYERALIKDRTCFPAQYNLGNVLAELNYPDKAIEAYKKALKLNPKYADCYYNIGLTLSKQKKFRESIEVYKEAIKLNPEHLDALSQLGSSYCELNHHVDAVSIFETAIKNNQANGAIYNNFGVALTQSGQLERAQEILKKAVSMDESNLDYVHNLGLAQAASGSFDQSIETFESIIGRDKTISTAYISLARSLVLKEDIDLAIEKLEEVIRVDDTLFDAWMDLASCYLRQQKETECMNALNQAQKIEPDSIIPLWVSTICQLKQFSNDDKEFKDGLDNYEKSLEKLEETIHKKDFSNWSDASDAANFIVPFAMILQDKNVKDIQAKFCRLLELVMVNSYPQWASPPEVDSIKQGDKIKVGVVSHFFYDHSVYKMITKGWFSNFDRSKFQLTAYSTSAKRDFLHSSIKNDFDEFVESTDFSYLCNRIRSDKQHILIYPSIGLIPVIYKLASLKLAPIQCAGWGHPLTSGVGNIDCLFVSDTFEPEDAANHYSEPIVKLPGMGSFYDPDIPEPIEQNFESDGIKNDSVKFLCLQTLHKYLPHHDEIFVRIAKKVPKAQFVFGRKNSPLASKLQKRLRKAFKNQGLDSSDHIVFLPEMNLSTYLGLCKQAHLFLDTPVNSGLLSSIEALETGIVPVTLSGDYMRSRQTAELLKMLDVEDTIANDIEEYIEIAIDLANNEEKRKAISAKILANKSRFYRDERVPEALQKHLEKAALVKYAKK